MATEPEYPDELDPNEQQEPPHSADQVEDESEEQGDELSQEDRHTLKTLKEHAPGHTIEEVLRLANDGVEFNRRRTEEERGMWEQREAEKKTEASAKAKGDDGAGDDLISRKEARQMVEESRQEDRAEQEHARCCAKYGLDNEPHLAYAARLFVDGAMADKANKDLTIELAYGYYMNDILKKRPDDEKKKKPKAEEMKESIRRSANVNRARPPASGGASAEAPSASGMPSWDNPEDPEFDLFDPGREERYKKDLGVT
ncbi:MAG: hypothetical protein ACYTG0_25025 [Planctomycetota bacterium]|jgi:hypothetical protein